MAAASMVSNSSNTIASSSSELYLAELLGDRGQLPEVVADWLEPLRQTAGDRVRVMSLPTQRDEEWRFTNLAHLKATAFQRGAGTSASIDEFVAPEATGHRLTFVNGHFVAELSDLSNIPAGVTVSSLGSLSGEAQERLRAQFSVDAMGRFCVAQYCLRGRHGSSFGRSQLCCRDADSTIVCLGCWRSPFNFPSACCHCGGT